MPECIHHFDIPPPDGPTSEGVCRLCGERREFHNSLPCDHDGRAPWAEGGESEWRRNVQRRARMAQAAARAAHQAKMEGL